MLLLTAGVAVLGFALTLVLPEPAGRSLEHMPVSPRETATMPLRVAEAINTLKILISARPDRRAAWLYSPSCQIVFILCSSGRIPAGC